MIRKIIHVDLDAFYASVEQLDHPEWRGQPLIVGGRPSERGVVATASYEARRYGIRSAMPCSQAVRLCPQVIIAPPRFHRYRELSKQVLKIYYEVSDLVEPLSLDEAYLDVTTNKLNEPSARQIARDLKARIKSEVGLTASAGAAPLKFVAKIASGMNKPDGLTVIPPAALDEFICQLPVEQLWSVGPATQRKLNGIGLFKAADFRKVSRAQIQQLLGKHGLFLYDLAHGRDERTINPHRERKSYASETTFTKDILDVPELLKVIKHQSEQVAASLQKSNLVCKTVSIKVRYSHFQTITRSRTFAHATDRLEDIEIAAMELLRASTEAGHTPIRLLGVTVKGLTSAGGIPTSQLQLPVLDDAVVP